MELISFILGIVAFGAIFLSVYFTNKAYKRRFKLLRAAAHAATLSREAILQLFGAEHGGLPAWIKLPDADQSVWLNRAIEVMWPHIDQAASAWAFKNHNLETLLNSSTFWKPAWLAASGVILQSLELGHLPPHVTGIKVYSNYSSPGSKSNALIADVNFDWVSQLHVVLTMKTISGLSHLSVIDRITAFLYRAVTVKVLVKDLIARGQMRIVLAPLLGEIPVVGAIKISFLGAPTISYNVSSFGANPLLIPGLESWLNSFIANQVMVPFTFPSGLDLNIGQLFGLAVAPPPVRPEGVLSVTVHNASGVPRMDIIGGADPYVKLFLTKKVKLRTTVQANTRSPQWEESFDFVVHDSRHQTLTLELWDSDSLRPDDMAGRVQVQLGSLDLTPGKVNHLSLAVPRMGKNGRKGPSYEDTNGDGGLGEEGRTRGQEMREVTLRKGQGEHGFNVPPGEREGSHEARVSEIQHPITAMLPGSPAKGLMPAMTKLSLGRTKQCTLNISVQFFKFSSGEARAAADAQKGLQAQLSNVSPRVRRMLRGGMLYINLSRAQGLSPHKGVTKTFKIKIKIGRLGGSPAYKKTAERSGLGRGLSASSPVFDDDVDFLVDGDTAHAPDTVVSVEIWVKHFLFKPTFKGRVVVPLARVLARGRMRDTFPLEGGSGTLDMGLEWQGVMEAM